MLDQKFGHIKWLKKIDLKLLDLSNGSLCICGQMFGTFWDAQFKNFKAREVDAEYLSKKEQDATKNWAIKHGFYAKSGLSNLRDYDTLTVLWYTKIVALKIKAGLIP